MEVALSVDRVKAHLHTLFETFDVGALPQNQKRVRLVEHATVTRYKPRRRHLPWATPTNRATAPA